MKIRNLLIPLVLIFLISLVIAQSCLETGLLNGTHYCDIDLEYKQLKTDGEMCANSFECQNQSCIDGLCQSKFVNISLNLTLRTGLIGEILDFIQGIECNPLNQTYYCEGTEAFLCGVNGVWESKGEVPGECGVPFFVCGNGILEADYEECDDGNNESNDSCKADCTWNICGDGSIYEGVEECDDGNDFSGDGCNDGCVIEECASVNETNCSGAYLITCNESYVWEIQNLTLGVCGVECLPIGNESCDFTESLICNLSYIWENLGNITGQCGYPLFVCGNGTVESPYEECDDGNNESNDSCKSDCTWNICGDGSIYDGLEQCDDGNTASGDGCNSNCIVEECSSINETNCSGAYLMTCNESYLWEASELEIGECGVECLPIGNESCNESNYLFCNSSYIWEDQGLVDGKCGYFTPTIGGGGGGGLKPNLVVYSPLNEVVYSAVDVPLQVADLNNKLKFWRYSLNGGRKIIFVPNTTIFPAEGQNTLIVFGRSSLTSVKETTAVVNFSAVFPVKRGYCGDGLCQENETCDNCNYDCGECQIFIESFCGDGLCDVEESSYNCVSDCVALERTDYTPVAIGVAASSIAVLGFVLYRRFFSQGAMEILDTR